MKVAISVVFAVVAAQVVAAQGVEVDPEATQIKPLMSSVYCGAGERTITPTCLTVPTQQFVCPRNSTLRSIPLPSCLAVSQQNVASLPDLLCPSNGTDVLPSCIKLQDANIEVGSISPTKLAGGVIPAAVKISGTQILNGAIQPSKLFPGYLDRSVTISAGSFVGYLSQSKLRNNGRVLMPKGVRVNNRHFAVNSIPPSRLTGGPLNPNIMVRNLNFKVASITQDKLGLRFEALNDNLKVAKANFAAGSIGLDRLTCQGSGNTNLSCVVASAKQLNPTCAAGTQPLQSCVAMPASSVVGNIAAAQVVGSLSGASIGPSRVQCQASDVAVPLPTCMTVDVSKQLECDPPTPGQRKALSCVGVDASQVIGVVATGMNLTVPAANLRGVISHSSVSIDGAKVVPSTISATHLPVYDDSAFFNTDERMHSPSRVVQLGNVPAGDVQICCPRRGIPTACLNPQINDANAVGNVYLSGDGVDIVLENGQLNGNACCIWYAPYTDDVSPALDVTFTAICIPGTLV